MRGGGGGGGELLKYGGLDMIELLHQLFAVMWSEEFVPPQWRESLVNLFKKGYNNCEQYVSDPFRQRDFPSFISLPL